MLSTDLTQPAAETMWEGHRPLSEREREVLALVADGLSNNDISKALLVSQATVKTHVGHLFDKLGVDSRTAAGAVARRRGLLD